MTEKNCKKNWKMRRQCIDLSMVSSNATIESICVSSSAFNVRSPKSLPLSFEHAQMIIVQSGINEINRINITKHIKPVSIFNACKNTHRKCVNWMCGCVCVCTWEWVRGGCVNVFEWHFVQLLFYHFADAARVRIDVTPSLRYSGYWMDG